MLSELYIIYKGKEATLCMVIVVYSFPFMYELTGILLPSNQIEYRNHVIFA